MKNWFAIPFLFASTIAFAGVESSGGGPSMVCRGSDHSIVSVRLLDLYEGETLSDLSIPNINAPFNEQLDVAASKLAGNPFVQEDYKHAVIKIIEGQRFLPDDVVIHPSNDLGRVAIPVQNGCTIEMIGYYGNDGHLLVSRTLLARLSHTDLAAFYSHEALYLLERKYHRVEDSKKTRELNALLFTDPTDLGSIVQRLSDFTWSRSTDVGEPLKPILLSQTDSIIRVIVQGDESKLRVMCVDQPYGETFNVDEVRVSEGLVTIDIPVSGCSILQVQSAGTATKNTVILKSSENRVLASWSTESDRAVNHFFPIYIAK